MEQKGPLALGTVTEWGTISAIRWDGYERFYILTDEHGGVALLPADVVEFGEGQ